MPASVSAQARAVLALGLLGGAEADWPELGDADGWRALVAERDRQTLAMAPPPDTAGVAVEEITAGGAQVYVVTPDGVAVDDRCVYLDIHGGGFIQEGGEICGRRAVGTAQRLGARCWSVDYRMPPDHPYPAPLYDCVAVYRALLEERRPEEVIVHGVSAGANLAAATVLRARDEGLPLPAGLVLYSPVSDLTCASDSLNTNRGLDQILTTSTDAPFLLYAGGHDLRDPYLSPVFGDFARGFPPVLLLTGTRDLLLSDTVRLHRAMRRAGARADLHVFEAAGHGGFLGQAPEDDERTAEIRRFAAACLREAAAGARG